MRYPLVIQTHGHSPVGEFSLYGMGGTAPGLGPGWSIYAAQALAGRGIMVLQLEDKKMPGTKATPKEPAIYAAAYEAAVKALERQGLIDPNKVGLSGFSRTGWHVEYALSHSELRYAAAITSDNISGGYFEETMVPGAYDRENGGVPFGAGLKSWLKTAPAFAAERIQTPLRSQGESGGVAAIMMKWELFARLRSLHKPSNSS